MNEARILERLGQPHEHILEKGRCENPRAEVGVPEVASSPNPHFIMKTPRRYIASLLSIALLLTVILGCKAPTLEPGGVYAPTNGVGHVMYNDLGLALADATYKLYYESALAVFEFERNNRLQIWSVSPKVKQELDRVRLQVQEVDLRWAKARKLYRQNPTPAGLSTIQTILAEIQRLAVVAQDQMKPVSETITKIPLR